MTREEVFNSIKTIMQDEFEDDSLVITENTTASDIEKWDSLEHICLMYEIENYFKIKFTSGEIQKLKNVGEIVTSVSSHVNK